MAARAVVATGVQPGDRVAIWAPNIAEWVIAALGDLLGRRGASCRSTPASRAPRRRTSSIAPTCGCSSPSPTSSHRLRRAAPRGRAGRVAREIVVLRGHDRPRARRGTSSSPRRPAIPDERRRASRRAHRRRPLRHPVHVGHHRPPEGRDAHARRERARVRRVGDVVGLRAGDRYLVVNPFFHTFGLKAGILACLLKGATIIPHAVFDVDAVMERVAEERVTMLPGPADDLPDDPRPPATSPTSTCRRCGSRSPAPPPVPGRDDPAHARRARIRDDRHRLRPHRGHGHRDDVPPRRRSRDDLDDAAGRAIPGVEVTSSTTTATRSPPASPARWWCAATT